MLRKVMLSCLILLVGTLFEACSSGTPTTLTTSAYGDPPLYINAWIPANCTDQGLPWTPYFQAGNGNSQFSGLGVQTLQCGRVWRFLAWDVDPSHNYHELSTPGKMACPNGEVRFTLVSVLLHDPYGNGPFVVILEESGSGNNWVALAVSLTSEVEDSSLYPPHCPKEK